VDKFVVLNDSHCKLDIKAVDDDRLTVLIDCAAKLITVVFDVLGSNDAIGTAANVWN
jgi:hypothetical protein